MRYPLVACKLGGKALIAGSNMAEGARDEVISMVGPYSAQGLQRQDSSSIGEDVRLT